MSDQDNNLQKELSALFNELAAKAQERRVVANDADFKVPYAELTARWLQRHRDRIDEDAAAVLKNPGKNAAEFASLSDHVSKSYRAALDILRGNRSEFGALNAQEENDQILYTLSKAIELTGKLDERQMAAGILLHRITDFNHAFKVNQKIKESYLDKGESKESFTEPTIESLKKDPLYVDLETAPQDRKFGINIFYEGFESRWYELTYKRFEETEKRMLFLAAQCVLQGGLTQEQKDNIVHWKKDVLDCVAAAEAWLTLPQVTQSQEIVADAARNGFKKAAKVVGILDTLIEQPLYTPAPGVRPSVTRIYGFIGKL